MPDIKIEELDKIPLRRRRGEEQREFDLNVVMDYFVHGKDMQTVMDKYGIKSKQTLYNARDRVNKLIEESKRNANGN